MKITDFTALTAANLADTDVLTWVDLSDTTMDASGTNKKMTWAELKAAAILAMQQAGMPRVTRLNSVHSISSTTGTEVVDLTQTLEAGTYTFAYTLIVRSATTTVGPMLGVNFTGTGAPRMHFRFADASTALTAEVHSMDDQGNLAFGFISGMANNIETTTAPNMGTTVGVATTATDILCFIEGIIIVTASGDLELWHSSETATATSVEVGSSLVVVRTA